MQWRFILPLPPSINHQYTERDGRWVLSREARHYKTHLQKAFRRLKAAGKFAPPAPEAPTLSLFDAELTAPQASDCFVRLRLEFFFKTPQRRDLDNGLKIVQDLVCDALGVDDKNVVAVELLKRVDAVNPRLEVTVQLVASWDFRGAPHNETATDLRPLVPPLSPSRRKRALDLRRWLAERAMD
ncbi:hypothetical protein HRbin17_02313 [bacterium HR17]|jgi:crossover junction endodeoxyribonuclease RusA|uniref:Uncharacterized protein n=1 Tax=Candidatus Fervidibacter japonicus TaxID=2035412 RepID=A0A2H5XF30_9BACT|nr:hypothetical protein HRbin17_02313 [bacterium HR17]